MYISKSVPDQDDLVYMFSLAYSVAHDNRFEDEDQSPLIMKLKRLTHTHGEKSLLEKKSFERIEPEQFLYKTTKQIMLTNIVCF